MHKPSFSRTSRTVPRLLSTLGLAGAVLLGPTSVSAAPPPPGPPIDQLPRPGPRFGPDLTISALSGTPTVQAVNGFVTYTIGASNVGILDASSVRMHWTGNWGGWFNGSISASNGFHCYVPAEYDTMDVRCVDGTIAAGQTATITITVRGPSTPGPRSVSAVVDPYAQIAELNENNNSASTATMFS